MTAICFSSFSLAKVVKPFVCAFGLLTSWVPVLAEDWPQWRGPRRDGISREKGLLQQWPADGPKLTWSATNLGRGYSSPIVVSNRIYITGDVGNELHVFALTTEGKAVWTATNGASWLRPYPGARATVTSSDGRLYHLNAHGRVVCLEPETGREVWAVNILERFGGKNITWGLSECLLVDGTRVIVTPGGSKGVMAALDKSTGETVWTSEPLRLGATNPPAHQRVPGPADEVDNASYATPMIFEQDGRRMIVGCSSRHVFGVNPETGKLLWTRPMNTRYQVIALTPVQVGDDGIFVTAPDGEAGVMYRVKMRGDTVDVEVAWRTELDACHGGAVLVGGALYGAMYRKAETWVSLNPQTGATKYRLEGLDKGSMIFADDRLYCLSEEGEIALLEPGSEKFEQKGRFSFLTGRKNDAWAHPVIVGGRLYLRYNDTLKCYDVKAR